MKHSVFARVYPRVAAWAEAAGAAEHRRELLGGATGRVIEVGAGHGANFPHYPTGVNEVLAVEPEPALRAQAGRAAQAAPVPVTVVGGMAEALPAATSSFDVAVTSLALCSVRDVRMALAEIRRVLRSGGQLRFYEHIRSHDRSFARYQRLADVLWPLFSGGCHLVRPTDELIAASGFTVTEARYFRFPAAAVPMSPHVLGRAVA